MRLVNVTLALLLLSTLLFADQKDKPRVYITDSQSWEVSGGVSGTVDAVSGGVKGGARPQTAEIVKTFGERCPNVTVTLNRDKADYVVVLEHEGGKNIVLRDNKFAIFNKEGDAIKSGSTRSLGNAVKNSCAALVADWDTQGGRSKQARLEAEEKRN